MRSALPLLAFLAVVACSAVSRVDPGDMADPGRYALQVGTESPAAGYRRFLLDEQEKPDPYDQFRRDARQPLCVSLGGGAHPGGRGGGGPGGGFTV